MCLSKVTSTKTKIKKDGTYYTGYKVVELSKTDKTFSTLYNDNKPFLKWLKNQSGYNKIRAEDNKLYECGFHVWTSKKAAQRYKESDEIICQVLFTKIIAEGIEDIDGKMYCCIITDKIMVLPPSKF